MRIKEKWKKYLSHKARKLGRKDILFICVFVAFTVFRMALGANTLLYFNTEAEHDDGLMIRQILSFTEYDWLGEWSPLLLIKGGAYASYVGVMSLLGIPYYIALYGLYIVADLVLFFALRPMIANRWSRFVIYIFMLFSPTMFCADVVQRIYRNALFPSASLLTISAFIGLFYRRNEKRKMLPWALLSGIGLSLFHFLCENSIWLEVFVVGAVITTAIYIFKEQGESLKRRVAMLLIPFFMAALVGGGFSATNYFAYGTAAINSRMDTSFKTMMGAMMQVERHEEDTNPDIWITKNMMDDMFRVSESLKSIEKEVKESLDDWGSMLRKQKSIKAEAIHQMEGQVAGDFTQWVMFDAMTRAGICENPHKMEEFCSNVTEELEKAFEDGTLEKIKVRQVSISSMARGVTVGDIPQVAQVFYIGVKSSLSFNASFSTIYDVEGDTKIIRELCRVLRTSNIRIDGKYDNKYNTEKTCIISNCIIKLYQKLSIFMIGLSVLGYLVIIRTIWFFRIFTYQ